MKYENISIKKAMQMIEEKKLLLPHIQRPFVWKQDRNNNQVKRFMDSIMRGYPFNTLLFWKTRDDIKLRRFIENYKDNMNVKDTYIKSSELDDKEKTLVLDGQQRLQTLYTALKGTYNGKEMYFDILSGKKVFQEGKDDLKYNFEYLTKTDAQAKSKDGSYWVKFKKIVISDDTTVRIKKQIISEIEKTLEVDDSVEEIIEDNVAQIKNLFNELDLIYYYPIDSTTGKFDDYEEILEIFIRTNSGGTVLGKSDLMFSLIKLNWEEAEEEFEDLLDILNNNDSFKFDKDFILKSALVIIEKKAQYRVEKFKGKEGEKNLKSIMHNWERIQKSFKFLDDFLAYTRITSGSMLPSYNALIPIVYYAYLYDSKIKSPKVKQNMQTWLYKALLNANFSGQSDSIIDICIDVIKDNSRIDYFPYKEIESAMKAKNRFIGIEQDIIDGNEALVLNILYTFKNAVLNFQPKINGNSPEIDHIFPKSKMTYTYKYQSRLVNNIGNYMYLEKSLNIDKTNILPEEYFPKALKQQKDFLSRNFIPTNKVLHKPEKFAKFVQERRAMIFDVIQEVLKYN
jgi:hypothetical protein